MEERRKLRLVDGDWRLRMKVEEGKPLIVLDRGAGCAGAFSTPQPRDALSVGAWL